MADKPYLTAAGFVQKFPNKDAVNHREANGTKVRDFTIKAVGSQKLIRVSVFAELAAGDITDGDYIAVEGPYSASGDNGQYHNITAARIFVGKGARKGEREVVNQNQGSQSAAGSEDSNPF